MTTGSLSYEGNAQPPGVREGVRGSDCTSQKLPAIDKVFIRATRKDQKLARSTAHKKRGAALREPDTSYPELALITN